MNNGDYETVQLRKSSPHHTNTYVDPNATTTDPTTDPIEVKHEQVRRVISQDQEFIKKLSRRAKNDKIINVRGNSQRIASG